MGFRIPRDPEAFTLDPSRKKHGGRRRSEGHLRFVRSLPCCLCGRRGVEAAHVRYGSPAHGKPATGLGVKPDDRFTVPLCVQHHREQHAAGDERAWWSQWGVEPLDLALRLFSASGDEEAAENVVRASRAKFEAVRA